MFTGLFQSFIASVTLKLSLYDILVPNLFKYLGMICVCYSYLFSSKSPPSQSSYIHVLFLLICLLCTLFLLHFVCTFHETSHYLKPFLLSFCFNIAIYIMVLLILIHWSSLVFSDLYFLSQFLLIFLDISLFCL